jgi:hypothetical protein
VGLLIALHTQRTKRKRDQHRDFRDREFVVEDGVVLEGAILGRCQGFGCGAAFLN